MCQKIQDYLASLHARHVKIDGPEVERRLARCRACNPHEACPRIAFEQWLPLLTTGGPAEAAELCQGWSP